MRIDALSELKHAQTSAASIAPKPAMQRMIRLISQQMAAIGIHGTDREPQLHDMLYGADESKHALTTLQLDAALEGIYESKHVLNAIQQLTRAQSNVLNEAAICLVMLDLMREYPNVQSVEVTAERKAQIDSDGVINRADQRIEAVNDSTVSDLFQDVASWFEESISNAESDNFGVVFSDLLTTRGPEGFADEDTYGWVFLRTDFLRWLEPKDNPAHSESVAELAKVVSLAGARWDAPGLRHQSNGASRPRPRP